MLLEQVEQNSLSDEWSESHVKMICATFLLISIHQTKNQLKRSAGSNATYAIYSTIKKLPDKTR